MRYGLRRDLSRYVWLLFLELYGMTISPLRIAYSRKPHRAYPGGAFKREAGNGLLSHNLSVAVPSALQGLTAVFGMGTGVAPAR
jgi:hypothetical protein